MQKQQIKKSPFGYLLLCAIENPIDESYVKKSDLEALKLVNQYQGRGGRFKLGSKIVRITEKEMTLMFGLQSGPKRIKLAPKASKPNTKFADQICSSLGRIITVASLRDYFKKAVKQQKLQDAKDVARVLTLFLIATVFFPNTSARVSWNYLAFVEDLENSTSYAWSPYITDHLIEELDTKDPKNVGGCIVGLLYWLCEHANLVNNPPAPKFPRFYKWRLTDLSEALAQTSLESLDPEKVIDSELVPTDEEKSLLQFVDVLKREPDDDEMSDRQDVDKENEPNDAKSEDDKEKEILINENKRLKEQMVELQNRISMLENEENKRLKEEIVELHKKISMLENDENKRLREEIVELEKKIATLQNETVEDLVFEVETVQTEKQFMEDVIEEKDLEVGGLMVVNDIIIEEAEQKDQKIAVLQDNIDDLLTHNVTQEFKKNQDVADKGEEENEEKMASNEGLPEHEIMTDEELDRTISGVYTVALGDDSPKKSTKNQVDPSSLIKGVKKTTTRTQKRLPDYIYTRKGRAEKKKASKSTTPWSPEMSKIANFLLKEDIELLSQICDCEKDDEAIAVWMNEITNDTVPLKDIITLLEEGDVSNSVIDGYTFMLDEEQQARQLMRGNIAYFTCNCWKNYVEAFMNERHAEKTKQPSFNLLSSPSIVFQQHDFNAPISSAEDAPQQIETSVDCGIVVCCIIAKLANQEPIPRSFSWDDVSTCRAHLVHSFLNNAPRSWSIAEWQAKCIAESST